MYIKLDLWFRKFVNLLFHIHKKPVFQPYQIMSRKQKNHCCYDGRWKQTSLLICVSWSWWWPLCVPNTSFLSRCALGVTRESSIPSLWPGVQGKSEALHWIKVKSISHCDHAGWLTLHHIYLSATLRNSDVLSTNIHLLVGRTRDVPMIILQTGRCSTMKI